MQYAGLDVHKESVQLCIVNHKGKVVRERTYPVNIDSLKELTRQLKKTRCVMESSSSCYPVYDTLREHRVKVKVANPLMVKAISAAKVKTDKVDARMLAQLERADLIPEAYIPEKETRQCRELIGQHITLTQQATRAKNRIRSILLRYRIGLPTRNLFGKTANWLQYVKATPEIYFVLEQSFNQLRELQKHLGNVDEHITGLAQQNQDAMLLKTVPGVGWFTAFLLAAYIDGIKRFPSPEHLVSYAGLTPRIRQSGKTLRTGKISKRGNPKMRWVLVQASWILVRKSPRFRKRFRRLAKKKGEKKAIIAVSRKLLSIMYFMLKRQTAFNEKAGGSKGA